VNQLANAKGSYGPYCRALERICAEESFHLKYGHHCVIYLAAGSAVQRKMFQEAIDRWWPPMMHFFGPADKISAHTEVLMRWKVKMATNDDMRNQFLDMYVPKIWELGFTIPDPLLKKNPETGRWNYTEPDWEEFKRVINGDGPCNRERLEVRRIAEERGKWVRDAVKNPAKKYVTPLA
jgi:ring-1,2-phenylacetyl-CoA epoxidase subunit PaaA